ncbi:MAG: hypothetical protein ACSLEX_03500 [Minisyncoccota bacterium]
MDESDQIKEVYARFGLAVYSAQVLELQMINMIVALTLPERFQIKRDTIDNLFDKLFEKTMGGLMQDFKKRFELTEKENLLLDKSLEQRNRLAHRYFREKAVDFMSFEGRLKMIDELIIINAHFEELDKILTYRHREYTKKFGVTEDVIEEEIKKLLL